MGDTRTQPRGGGERPDPVSTEGNARLSHGGACATRVRLGWARIDAGLSRADCPDATCHGGVDESSVPERPLAKAACAWSQHLRQSRAEPSTRGSGFSSWLSEDLLPRARRHAWRDADRLLREELVGTSSPVHRIWWALLTRAGLDKRSPTPPPFISAWDACKAPWTERLRHQKFIFSRSGGGKSAVRVPAGLVRPFLGADSAFLLCPPPRGRDLSGVSPRKGTNPITGAHGHDLL